MILTAYAPESFAKNAKKIIFNIDKAELNKNAVAADCLIEMSASEALSFLTEKYQAASGNDWIHWCSNIRQIFANEIFQTNEVIPSYHIILRSRRFRMVYLRESQL